MYISKVEISKYKGFNEATIEYRKKKEIVGMGFLSRHFIGRIERKCSINKNQFVFFHVK